ncbi:hypothetical protein HAX54_008112 [Datura stramonium]|uniref:Response regulatory domain-containing protein n=1 Tax=Datura stramonium TaxID=4076 RepID=A0ABS8TCS0_DATST|nr:hypothetical protein [Datura stramonium]
MASPYHGMIEEVHVMLVDDDTKFVTVMVDLLKSYDYKGMSMLSKGKKKFDVMIINVHSFNPLSFQLLAQAVAFDIISLFVCDEYNELLAKKAMDEGTYFYLEKPFDEEFVKYLWQFILREKIQREKEREKLEKNGDLMNVDDIGNNSIVGDNEKQHGEKKNVSNTEKRAIIFMRLQTISYRMGNTSRGGREVEKARKRLMKEKAKPMLLIRLLGESLAQNGLWIFMPNSWKLCNNLVKENVTCKSSSDAGNATINDYNLNVNVNNVTTYSCRKIMFDTYAENATISGLGAANANFQQHICEPNMSDPRNIVAASYESDIEGSDSNEKEKL